MSREYQALVEKVDGFCRSAEQQAGDALSCRRGCSACCHVWLDVSAVEAHAIEQFIAALPAETRAELARRGEREAAREREAANPRRCPMLDDDDACTLYPARPLICRTQGLSLRYPADTVPAASVRFEGHDGSQVVACPLNYTERPPTGDETLDAHAVDTLLALVNHRHAQATGDDPNARRSLIELARKA